MQHVTRAQWGAQHPDGSRPAPGLPDEWWLHHSVTLAPDLGWLDADRDGVDDDEEAAVRTLERIGHARFGAGISYTWLVPPSGRLYAGHTMGRIGTHTSGRNTRGRSVCLIGDYQRNEPTDAQLRTVAQLLVDEHRAGRHVTHRLNGGHRDLKATDCPGRYAYACIGEINRRAAALWITPTEEDDMTPDQARKLDELHAALAYTHPDDATYPHPGSLSNAIVSTWAQVFWTTQYAPALRDLHDKIDALTQRVDDAIGPRT